MIDKGFGFPSVFRDGEDVGEKVFDEEEVGLGVK